MADKTALIVGLGNPGKEYARNRHNAGFLAADDLAGELGVELSRSKWEAQYGTARFRAESGNIDVVLMKPMTFMNLSGQSACPAAKFYKIPPERLLVLHDEIDIEFGDVRLKQGGGHAGHNGLRDIISRCGSRDFARIRIGVGRPAPGRGDVADYVLSDFAGSERQELSAHLTTVRELALDWLKGL